MKQSRKPKGYPGALCILLAGFLAIGLAGCAQPIVVRPAATSLAAASCRTPSSRPDVMQHWLDSAGRLRWPANEGFAAAPVPLVLPAGLLIDRFGCPTGRFFSPQGASFQARSLPYGCKGAPYSVYRIDVPLLAWTGRAAPWFDEPGGATQFETDASASQLLAAHVISKTAAVGSPCAGG